LIEAKYKWGEQSFLTASKIAYEYSLKHSFKRYLGWIFIAITQFGVVAALKKGAFGLLLFSTVLVVYWYFLRWPIRAFFIKRSFKKSKLSNKEFIVKIDENFIEFNGIKINWDEIKNIVEIKEAFLIELGSELLFLPKNSLKNDAIKYIVKIAKSKNKFVKDEDGKR